MANPTQTDEDFVKDFAPQPVTAKPVNPVTPPTLQLETPQTDESFVQSFNPLPATKVQTATVSHTNFIDYLGDQFAPYAQAIDDDLKIGSSGIHRSTVGGQAAVGLITYEDAEAQIKNDELEAEEAGQRNDAFKKTGVLPSIFSFTEPAIQSLPFLTHLAASYGAGAGVGAAAGLVTGPGVLATATLGGDASVYSSMTYHAMGDGYMQLRKQGIDHDTARVWSYALGTTTGLLGSLRLKQLGTTATNAMATELKTGAGQELVKNGIGKFMQNVAGRFLSGKALTEFAKSVGFQTGIGASQAVANLTATAAAAAATGKAQLPPKEIASMFVKQVQDAAAQAALFTPAAHVIGTATGAAIKKILPPPKGIEPALEAIAIKHANPEMTPDEVFTKVRDNQAAAELKAQTPVEDLEKPKVPASERTKGELARDEKKKLLQGFAEEHTTLRVKMEKDLQRAEEKYNSLKAEKDLKYAKFDEKKLVNARIKRDTLREDLKAVKKNEKNAIEEHDALEEKHQKIELARVVKLAASTASKKNGALPDSQFERGTTTQRFFNYLREFVNNQTSAQETIDNYEYYAERIKEKDSLIDLELKHDAAQMVNDLRNKSSEQLRSLGDQIKQIADYAKAGRSIQLALAIEKRVTIIHDMRKGAQGITRKGLDLQHKIEKLQNDGKEVPQNLIDELKKEEARVQVEDDVNPESNGKRHNLGVDMIQQGGVPILGNFGQILKLMLRNAPNRDALVERLNPREHLNNVAYKAKQDMKMLMGTLTEATGKSAPQVNELIRLGAKKRIKIKVYSGKSIIKDGVEILEPKYSEMTVNQAMDKLAQLDDVKARDALIEGNAFMEETPFEDGTKGDILAALRTVDEAYPKMVQGYVKAYQKMRPRVAERYEKVTGEVYPTEENYSGPIRHAGMEPQSQEEFGLLMENKPLPATGTAKKPGFFKKRSGSKKGLEYDDIHQKFQRYVNNFEQYDGMYDFAKEVLGPVRRDPILNRIWERKYGRATVKSFHDAIDDIVKGTADKKNLLNDFLAATIMKNTAIYMLGVKPLMYVKHNAAIVTAAKSMPVGALVDGVHEYYDMSKGWDAYAKRRNEISNTPEFITRHGFSTPDTGASAWQKLKGFLTGQLASEDLNTIATTQVPDQMKHPFFSTVDHYVMSPTVYGIKGTDRAILYAARKYYMSEKGGGLTEREALVKGGNILHDTQVSGAIDKSSAVNRTELGKFGLMFQGQMNNLAVDTFVEANYAFAHPTKENITTAAKAIVISGLATAVFEGTNTVYNMALARDDKEREEEAFKGQVAIATAMVPIANYPYIKDGVKFAATVGSNAIRGTHYRPFEGNGILGSFGKNVYGAMKDTIHASADPDWASKHVLQLLIDVDNTLGWTIGSVAHSPLHTVKKVGNKLGYNEVEQSSDKPLY